MTGIRLFGWSAALLAACTGISSATPPDIVRTDEDFFGAGDAGFAVIRTVSDNKGSYYINRTTTFLVEKPLDGGAAKETPLLDRETIVDAAYEGPGKPPVKVVIHSKNEKAPLGSLIEKWPNRGREVEAEELKRFALHDGGLKYDDRLELPGGKAVVEELALEGGDAAAWIIREGIERGGTLFLKLFHQEEEGDSVARWVSLGSGSMDQVNAFRNIHPVYLSYGVSVNKEEALARVAELRGMLKEKQLGSFDPIIWKINNVNGGHSYVVVVADSPHLIESGKLPEVETKLGLKLIPVASSRFTEWVPENP